MILDQFSQMLLKQVNGVHIIFYDPTSITFRNRQSRAKLARDTQELSQISMSHTLKLDDLSKNLVGNGHVLGYILTFRFCDRAAMV